MSARWLLAVAASVVVPWPAWAQDSSARAKAVHLFDEAELLMKQGDVARACPKYAASMQLDPQLGALLHLADCYEKNGQLASAWGAFRQAEEMARSRGDDRVAIAHEYASQLEPRVSRLTVAVSEPARVPGLELRLDGALLPADAWSTPNPIDPGKHTVEARAPGYRTFTSNVSIGTQKTNERVEVPTLVRAATDGIVLTSAPAPADGVSPLRVVGWVGVGVGAVGLGVGAVFLAKRNSKVEERDGICPTHVCETPDQGARILSLTDEARTADTLSTVGFIAGGALLAGGITALLVAPRHRPASGTAWLAPLLTPHAGGAAGGITW